MTILYIIGAATIAVFLNRVWRNKKQTASLPSEALNKNRFGNLKGKPNSEEKNKIDLITSGDRPEIGNKNKWLYPADNFGKMEKGVVA